jgi:hypothetical protein
MDLSAGMEAVMAVMGDMAEATDQWDFQVELSKYQTKNILKNWEKNMIQTESFSGNKYSKG